MKKAEKQKRQVMDGEVKSGKKLKTSTAAHLRMSRSGNNEGKMEGDTEESRKGEQREQESKKKSKKGRKEKGTDVSGDRGTSGEKRARTGRGDENGQDVKESQIIKRNKGEEESKPNVSICSVSHSSTVDLISRDKNIKHGTHRRERAEVDMCDVVQTLSADSSVGDERVVWVQCSKPKCGKWRRLSDGHDPSVLPDDWTCQNNTDPTFSSCSAPEEKSSVSEADMFFYSLVPGSLVWARQSGYPWWPAMVECDPDTKEYLEFRRESDLTPYKCHVTYFGEPVTRAWVVCNRVKDYADLSDSQLNNVVDKSWQYSISMAKEALKLSLKERLVRFGFCSRYVSDRESSVDSCIADMLEVLCGNPVNDCSDKDSRSGKTSEGSKLKKRKRKQKSRGQGKEDTETCGEVEKKKGVKKMMNEAKEIVINGEPVKGGQEKKHLTPSFFSMNRKKYHRTVYMYDFPDTTDQTVPLSAMETTADMTFDLDIHFEGDEMEGKRDRVKCGAEERERSSETEREDEDEEKSEEEQGRLLLLEE